MTGVQTCALPICFPVTIRRRFGKVCYANRDTCCRCGLLGTTTQIIMPSIRVEYKPDPCPMIPYPVQVSYSGSTPSQFDLLNLAHDLRLLYRVNSDVAHNMAKTLVGTTGVTPSSLSDRVTRTAAHLNILEDEQPVVEMEMPIHPDKRLVYGVFPPRRAYRPTLTKVCGDKWTLLFDPREEPIP